MKKAFILMTALALFIAGPVYAQEKGGGLQAPPESFSKAGTIGLQFLKVGVGARPLAMGRTGVSIADDASALFWNPAGIARQEKPLLFGAYTRWFAEIDLSSLAYIHPVGDRKTVALSVTMLTTGYMNYRTVEFFEGNGDSFTFRDLAIGASYAQYLTDKFAFGGTIKFIREDLVVNEFSDQGLIFDLGALYDTGFHGMRLGFAVTNFGQDFKYAVDNDGDGIKDEDKQNNLDDDGDGLVDEDRAEFPVPAPLHFQFGLSYPFVQNGQYDVRGAFEIARPNDGDTFGQYNLGLEMVLSKMIALRGGYRLNLDEGGLTAGVGINFDYAGIGTMTLDYAFNNFGRIGNVHRASFGINF